MNALLQDPRVARQFDTWGQHTGLYRAADGVAKAGDTLAAALGLGHRNEVFGDAAQRTLLQCEGDRRVIRLGTQFCSRAERLSRLLNKKGGHRLRASAFVRDELGLLWGWLA